MIHKLQSLDTEATVWEARNEPGAGIAPSCFLMSCTCVLTSNPNPEKHTLPSRLFTQLITSWLLPSQKCHKFA